MFEIHVFIDWQKPRTGFIASVFVHASAKLRVRTPSTPSPPLPALPHAKKRETKKNLPPPEFLLPPLTIDVETKLQPFRCLLKSCSKLLNAKLSAEF